MNRLLPTARFLLPAFLILAAIACKKENQPPVAQFIIDPATGNDQTIFVMDASGTSDPDNGTDELMLMWDYEGDGVFDTPYANRLKGDRKYAKAGSYTVTLVVKDPRGLTDTVRVPLVVSSSNLPPETPFSPEPAQGAVIRTIKPWMKWSSSDPEGDPLFFTCYFGTTNPPPQVIASQMFGTFSPGELNYGTTYYWKVKVRDSKGNITEGPVWSFSTYNLIVGTVEDSRDGQTYQTIKIGEQWWMRENLRYATTSGSWCYDDNSDRCNLYGRLYTWEAAVGACPDGWRLPTLQEFQTLIALAGGLETAGGQLKDNENQLWREVNVGATNELGFNALPAGRRYDSGLFAGAGLYTQFTTSNEYNYRESYTVTLGFDYANAFIYNSKKSYGISVRCIRK